MGLKIEKRFVKSTRGYRKPNDIAFVVLWCFNGVISHRIPFGFGSLLLKLGKLSAIFDCDQQLPYEQANKAQ